MKAPEGLPAALELVRPVGRGGYAEVFEVRRGDERLALKVLRPELFEDAFAMKRFEREARALDALDHPAIARLAEAAETATGRPYLLYEWRAGSPLAQAGQLAIGEAVGVTREVLGALGAAHAAGVLHRDLSAGNVLLAPDGRVSVLDFGMAASVARAVGPAEWTRLTATGLVLGTPPYVAPEVIEGERADERADVWAAGVLLYRMLTGAEPFPARTRTLRMLKVVSEAARPVEGVEPELKAILARALAGRAERFASAAAFAEALATVAAAPGSFAGSVEPSVLPPTR